MLDPAAVAREAAQELGAEMDPGLPGCVERILSRSRGTKGMALADGETLGDFIVAAADTGCRLLNDFRTRVGEPPAWSYVQRQLQRQMGIDEGMSPERDAVIDTLVAVLMHRGAQLGS